MTVMQLIIPPAEESGSEDETHGSKKESTSSTALPPALRESFESVKAISRELARGQETEELRHKQRQLAVETATAVDTEIAQWQNGIAELEAMLAAEEAQDGASDSDGEGEAPEVWIDAQGHVVQDPARGRPIADHVRFPSLPPVVPLDED